MIYNEEASRIIAEIEELDSDNLEALFDWFQSKALVGGMLVDNE